MAFRSILATAILFSFLFATPLAAATVEVRRITPDDPFYLFQTHIKPVMGDFAWSLNTGSKAVVVAVIDTGVDIDHPDLKDNIWSNSGEVPGNGLDDDGNGYTDDVNGWDFVSNTNDPRPKFDPDANPGGVNHGTIIAGVIGAVGNNRQGVTGLNWNVRIMPIRLLDGTGYGVIDRVDDAIRYAVRNGASIINLSFTSDRPIPEMDEAIREAYRKGVLIVTAAGNDIFNGGRNLDEDPIYPACSGTTAENLLLAVASSTELDQKSDFSNFGANCVDLSAPGESIFSTQVYRPGLPGYTEAYGGSWSGTSLSSAVVTGAAALIKSRLPNLGAHEIIQTLLQAADPIDGINPLYQGRLGRGRLNIKAALERLILNPPEVTKPAERIVAAKGAGAAPLVQAFTKDGLLTTNFQPYPSWFRGGVRLAVADIDGDGIDEIIVAPGAGYAPYVKIYGFDGKVRREFLAFPETYRGGVFLAAGDVVGDGRSEIIVGAGAGSSLVKIFSGQGKFINSFEAFSAPYKGGATVATADLFGDGKLDIVVGMAALGQKVLGFNADGALIAAFADPGLSARGVNVGAVDLDGDGSDEVMVASRRTGSGVILTRLGQIASRFQVTGGAYLGGVTLGSQSRTNSIREPVLASLANQSLVYFLDSTGRSLKTMKLFSSVPYGGFQAVWGVVRE